MAWIVYALVGQLFWSLGNIFDKFLLSKFSDDTNHSVGVLLLFSGAIGIFVTPLVLFFRPDVLMVPALGIFLLLLNGCLVLGWLSCYLYALEIDDASTVIPLFQFIPVFGYILGLIFLHEVLSPEKVAAGLVVIIGAFLLTIQLEESYGRRFKYQVLLLMMGASFIEASTNVLFKSIALETSFWTSTFWTYAGMALGAIVLYCCVKHYRREFNTFMSKKMRSTLGLNMTNEVIDLLGNLFFLYALILAPVAIVQTSTAFQPILVLVLAPLISLIVPHRMKEKMSFLSIARKSLAVTIIVVGSAHLYFL